MIKTQIHLDVVSKKLAAACVLLTCAIAAPLRVSGQTFTVLYSFTGGVDGWAPYAGLVRDNAGNLYGTTSQGGSSGACTFGCGVVFKVDTFGTETVLHSFSRGDDGATPAYGYMVRDNAGNLYGTTYAGGAAGNGVAFRIAPNGKELSLPFRGGANGGFPYAGLVKDSAGNFYGTTLLRGTGCAPYGCGTVYKISPTGKQTVLHSFTGGTDGSFPWDQLVLDSTGNLYGTTETGGPSGLGTVFKIAPNGQETVYDITSGGGLIPVAGLVADRSGNLYGTTLFGGIGSGSIFKLDTSGQLTLLYSFCSLLNCADGSNPYGGLTIDASGNLYGTTSSGGGFFQAGTIFKLDPSGQLTTLYSFCTQPPNCADGDIPYAGLILDGQGNLYGTATAGGASNSGTVFKLAPQ